MNTIILDLDGTILDNHERLYQCYADILKSYQLLPISKEDYWQKKRNGIKLIDILALSNAENLLREFEKRWFANIEKQDYLQLDKPFYQSMDILSKWKKNRLRLILVTLRHDKINLFWQLKELNIFQLFSAAKKKIW